MNRLFKTLATTLTLIVLLTSVVQSVHAAAWVEHKFKLQLPDGKTKDLKGGKIHIFHKQHEAGGAGAFNSSCYYPEKPAVNEHSQWAKDVKESMDEDDENYHCATPSSCTIIDYGAPFLPANFNEDNDVYTQGDASYKSFYGKTFSQALKDDAPFAYLANKYEKGNIRGFSGAKWSGKVDYSASDSKGPVAFATKDEITTLNNNPDWGKNLPGFANRQSWEEGEVFKDPQGGNVLHGRITWVLKAPTATAPEKPTASLAGKCATTNPGVPSYIYTLSNIDLKGGTFKSSHLHLNVTKGAWTNEFKQQFGPPIYENSSIITYSLIFTTAAPTNNTITWNVLPTEGVGNQASNTKTVADLVKWVDAKKAAGVTIPFEIKTNLESEKDGLTTLNDSISVASNGFKPKFVTNECGTPPVSPPPTGGGTIPACVSIKMLNGDNQPITNMGALVPGALVKFECGPVTGVSKYAFRLITFDAQGKQIGNPTNINPESASSNRSRSINIPNEGGRFTAQCAICENNSTNCQFDIPNYNPPTPTTTVQCGSPNSCVTPSGCITPATSGTCAVSGQICCANRRRDPEPTPAPTATPTSTQCVSPNSCISATSCATANRVAGKVCATSGQVCCTTRPRDE